MSALDIFYDEFNDVHFFVEDEDQENLYEVIIARMLPDLEVSRVFPLGGKPAVINHAENAARRDGAPPAVYLVDKDFDDLLGSRVDMPMLFYLDRYCIENYFLDARAVVEVVIETMPKKKRAEVELDLALDEIIQGLVDSLRPLFQLFYCVQRFSLGIKNCAQAAETFCLNGRRWAVDPVAVEAYEAKVVQAAKESVFANDLQSPLTHAEVSRLSTMDPHCVVSGKYLCALLFHYVKSKYNLGSITLESFLFRLAKNSSLSSLDSVGARIQEALGRAPQLVR